MNHSIVYLHACTYVCPTLKVSLLFSLERLFIGKISKIIAWIFKFNGQVENISRALVCLNGHISVHDTIRTMSNKVEGYEQTKSPYLAMVFKMI